MDGRVSKLGPLRATWTRWGLARGVDYCNNYIDPTQNEDANHRQQLHTGSDQHGEKVGVLRRPENVLPGPRCGGMRQTCNRVPGGFHLGPGHTFPAFLQTCNRVPDRTKRVTGRPNSIFIWDPVARFRAPFLARPPGCTFRVAHPTWDPVTRFVRFLLARKRVTASQIKKNV